MGVRKNKSKWMPEFLASYRVSGNVAAAARDAGVSRRCVYNHKESDREFAELFEEATQEGADTLEAEARRRAVDGVDEPVYYQGDVVGHVRKFSDLLLMFLLKGLRPEKYRERVVLPPAELDRLIEQELAKRRGQDEDDAANMVM
jgi:hypothetical protein